MTQKSNYFKIGFFVIAGFSLAVFVIVVLGAGSLFRKQIVAETYFDESVQGLDIGSAVKYRGMLIGRVNAVTTTAAVYAESSRSILVRYALFADVFTGKNKDEAGELIEKHVQRGLRVRLAPQGLTGTAYLEADYLDPTRYPKPKLVWEPSYPYIPSTPSMITQYTEAISRIMRSLEKIDVEGLAGNLNQTLASLHQALDKVGVDKVSAEAQQFLAELRATNQRIQSLLQTAQNQNLLSDLAGAAAAARRITEKSEKPLTQALTALDTTAKSLNQLTRGLDASTKDLPEILAQIKVTVRRLDQMVSAPQQDLETTMSNLRQLSEHLKELADGARKNPSQVLLGDPPRPISPGKTAGEP